MKSIKTILLVEGNPGDARLLQEMLKENETLNIELVTRMSEVETSLAAGTIDIALLDLGLPDAQGLEAIRRAHAAAPHVPLVVLTGLDDEGLAVEALQLGSGFLRDVCNLAALDGAIGMTVAGRRWGAACRARV